MTGRYGIASFQRDHFGEATSTKHEQPDPQTSTRDITTKLTGAEKRTEENFQIEVQGND